MTGRRTLREDGGVLSRFTQYKAEPDKSYVMRADHPAAVEGRTLFPNRVTAAKDAKRFLISGHNNAKIGKVVMKGHWAAFPIFTLTLEERATCPRTCDQWLSCYGSSMQWPSRWDHRDPDFMEFLRAEIITTCRLYPDGLVIRLHVLGDFFSVAYVKLWADMLDMFPQLHVYGYSARDMHAGDEESRNIGMALAWLADEAFDQFAMRFSRSEAGPGRAIVVDEPVVDNPDVVMCPAQVEATTACATCGLWWAPAARTKTIAFLRHGLKRGRRPSTEFTHKPLQARSGPLPAKTPEARIEAVPEATKREILARYGAIGFKRGEPK